MEKLLVLAAVVGLVAVVIVLLATPGSVLTLRYADGAPAHREYLVSFVGLLMLGLVALGLDIRDWL